MAADSPQRPFLGARTWSVQPDPAGVYVGGMRPNFGVDINQKRTARIAVRRPFFGCCVLGMH
ncbi:hypothetical protein LPBF_04935 [Flavobacterium crassostreae]|uniref:Uncharacterized protein n=1 Tax=Flavobacterium crassostreae TaxID=1763534 RepID=A0A1B9E645_9FLAO|nr:hypothetical protein LPBF_04935 [Flavobacterium crassostreae]